MHMPYKVDSGPTYRRIRQKKTRTRSKARPRPAVKAGARPPAGENLAAALHLAPWRAPTGDTQPKVLVRAGELTCLNCFETFTPGTGANEPGAGFCLRCGGHRGIPTLSYLFEENYPTVHARPAGPAPAQAEQPGQAGQTTKEHVT